MSLMNRSKRGGRGRKFLLVAVALILAVPCVAAAAFNLQLDVNDITQPSPDSGTVEQAVATGSTQSERKARLISHSEAEYLSSWQQDRRAQEEREAKERAIKERAERDPEFRAKLEQRAREEQEIKERAERDPEFRAQLEQREREEREIKERIEGQIREIKEALQRATNDEERARLEAKLKGIFEQTEKMREPSREIRGAGVAAAKWARISMEQAIQIATSQTPGKVLQCSLIGEREDRVFYHVVIFSGSEENPVTTHVLVNAVNGVIVKSERGRPEISGGTLNGKAVNLPNPEYPEIARNAGASGSVSVEVTIDESGNVISAKAISGHPLLQAASVRAARAAQFSPTRLNGEPVKVKGVLTYNFVAN